MQVSSGLLATGPRLFHMYQVQFPKRTEGRIFFSVVLDRLAGPDGVEVFLQSDNANAEVPSSVWVPSGLARTSFIVTCSAVSARLTVHITASLCPTTMTVPLVLVP